MLRLLWHCCGHLYSKHWDHLAALNLRPQFGLVLAHITKIAKIFTLMDSKELTLLTKTLGLVRPPYISEPPTKRIGACDESSQGQNGINSMALKWSRVPASKSGSWGGHPTPTVFTCKSYAQTC